MAILFMLEWGVYHNIHVEVYDHGDRMRAEGCAVSPAFQTGQEFDGLDKAVAGDVASIAVLKRTYSKVQLDH